MQELLAPSMVLFVDRNWQRIGYKGRMRDDIQDFVACEKDLTGVIHEITGIRKSVLYDYNQSQGLSFEEKQEWVMGRETTREEDKAYCLLGIFNVSMPLVYGEKRKAQKRLLKEIQEKESEKELKRKRKMEKKLGDKRKPKWLLKKTKRVQELETVPEECRTPPKSSPRVRTGNDIELLRSASEYEDSCTREHRYAAMVSTLRHRWTEMGERDTAIHSVARSLQKLGYSDPGESIHNALQHVAFRAQQVQQAYFDMMRLDWTFDRAVQHMAKILQIQGHSLAVAEVMVLEYLMYDPIAVDACSFPYIRTRKMVAEDEKAGNILVEVDESVGLKHEAVVDGNVVSSSIETALSGPGVSRPAETKASKTPGNGVVTFESFVQIHLFC